VRAAHGIGVRRIEHDPPSQKFVAGHVRERQFAATSIRATPRDIATIATIKSSQLHTRRDI
jgi:hypothetical protein